MYKTMGTVNTVNSETETLGNTSITVKYLSIRLCTCNVPDGPKHTLFHVSVNKTLILELHVGQAISNSAVLR